MFCAVVSIGAICSTVNPIATAEEIGAQFADSEAVMLVTIPELIDKCSAAARLASTVRNIVVIGEADGAIPWRELFTHGDTSPAVFIDHAQDVAALPYSSGMSGVLPFFHIYGMVVVMGGAFRTQVPLLRRSTARR